MKLVRIANRNFWHPFPISMFVLRRHAPDLRLEDFIRLHEDEWRSGDVFVIDAHFSWNGSGPLNLDGIRLLKILRMFGYRQHCILYSFLPSAYLFAHYPYMDILLSRGTTFVQLPDTIDRRLCRSRKNQSCEEDMLPFFQSEVVDMMSTKRHSLANWWGVLRSYEILHSVGIIGENVPEVITRVLDRDSSYRGILMNLARFQGQKPKAKLFFDTIQGFQKSLSALWQKNLKVVYVDDQADEGWSYLLQIILYGKEMPDRFFVPSLVQQDLDVNALTREIISLHPDLVILDLRLAPKDESVTARNLSGIAIARALTDNPATANCCPILVFTASDKRGVSEEAIAAGADGVWTKEGIDESRHLPPEEYSEFSMSRLQQLIAQIERLTGKEYGLLFEFLRRIQQIHTSVDDFWWQKTQWYPSDPKNRIPLDKSRVISQLIQLFLTHKQFLSANHPLVNEILYDMLTVRLCRMMELFHPVPHDASEEFVSLGRTALDDWPADTVASHYAKYLVYERNAVVHINMSTGNQSVDMFRYGNILDSFLRYISFPDPSWRMSDNIRIEGELYSQILADRSSIYKMRGRSLGGTFSKEDADICNGLLNEYGPNCIVQAKPIRILQYYQLKSARIEDSSDKKPLKDRWTAEFRIHKTGAKWTSVFLLNIIPRKGVRFVGETAAGLNFGERIFFHIAWKDNNNGPSQISLLDICNHPLDTLAHTYWSADIIGVEAKGPKTSCFYLEKIAPPFNAFFRVNANDINFLEYQGGSFRLSFLPDFVQGWILTDPRIKTKETPDQ